MDSNSNDGSGSNTDYSLFSDPNLNVPATVDQSMGENSSNKINNQSSFNNTIIHNQTNNQTNNNNTRSPHILLPNPTINLQNSATILPNVQSQSNINPILNVNNNTTANSSNNNYYYQTSRQSYYGIGSNNNNSTLYQNNNNQIPGNPEYQSPTYLYQHNGNEQTNNNIGNFQSSYVNRSQLIYNNSTFANKNQITVDESNNYNTGNARDNLDNINRHRVQQQQELQGYPINSSIKNYEYNQPYQQYQSINNQPHHLPNINQMMNPKKIINQFHPLTSIITNLKRNSSNFIEGNLLPNLPIQSQQSTPLQSSYNPSQNDGRWPSSYYKRSDSDSTLTIPKVKQSNDHVDTSNSLPCISDRNLSHQDTSSNSDKSTFSMLNTLNKTQDAFNKSDLSGGQSTDVSSYGPSQTSQSSAPDSVEDIKIKFPKQSLEGIGLNDDFNLSSSSSLSSTSSSAYSTPSNIGHQNKTNASNLKNFAHVCHICGKQFKRKSWLQRHLLSHSSERNFDCPWCLSKHKRKDNLLQHMKLKHAENVLEQLRINLKANNPNDNSEPTLEGNGDHNIRTLMGEGILNKDEVKKLLNSLVAQHNPI
ncbi:hypothetical protein Kpol_1018p33 [Vanderwaltozyma polyspora DSM 70294]|uniref:C2H2-type domain-containing protein n=1 Tax=Vanderwaltozyma polyspora (strain ATCC 22028 / DSM 70294 / BCRC 21397 / CBS 2163 / NBRC 10782 / NRRL Y-8283 / UCD 57-17) TaxID=436907 RepID=A7TDN4_VANPO|nr:uncharacterized protein Kpol_1018p33 [Vanderwaltozyma polyspora DSM 70294]EDO19504.1 hypothetical protein Kpol_1018p33 [Vanderwaltozyma polyspora DSM 70294]